MEHGSRKNELETTHRSLELVETIKRLDGATLAELTNESGLAKSTVFKHLKTLAKSGYLEKEGERYHIGMKFYNLGQYARTRKRAYNLATKTARRLTEETNEEVDVGIENDDRELIIYESYHPEHRYEAGEVQSRNPDYHTGTYYYLHWTAAGKALLAAMPDSHVERIVDRWGLPSRTEQTITEESALYDELETIRDRGYALSDEEFVDGLRAVGRSVCDPTGEVVCAISLFAPAYRMTDDRFTEEIPALLEEATTELEREINPFE
ncbi:IclR family transcriptional regulator [Natrarchaeobius halalkaliphilus]|uniref:IclR family transcriptional regulator n=1 Tax=Natrarchaeobius halalkaliphilus TaxID=1679091 RepID=A0A3N6M5I1_9EURY|nr:IclR family transcriptional regulator [Natrarchaeobius halalkaliphilus]RQG87989.1 IclR family transcriptional regulator [Natrarchaeobius halalkaliphilus]